MGGTQSLLCEMLSCGTLYKNRDQRICGECRKKKEEEANG